MAFAQASRLVELRRRYSDSIVLDSAAASGKVDDGVDSGGTGIERVLQQLQHDVDQGDNGRRRLDLGGDMLWQRPNAHADDVMATLLLRPSPAGNAWFFMLWKGCREARRRFTIERIFFPFVPEYVLGSTMHGEWLMLRSEGCS